MDPQPTSFGDRLRRHRQGVGMSRPVLAGLVGRSAEWVKAVETGRLGMPRLSMLLRLAEVLGLRDLAMLTGDPSVSIERFGRGQHPAVAAIRAAVQQYQLTRPDQTPEPVTALRIRAGRAWRAWHTSTRRRDDVGAVLPGLLADAQHAATVLDGPDRRAAHTVLADIYHLAQHALVNACEPALLWLVVDRAMAAARVADDPLTLAGAAWTVAMMQRADGRMDEAVELVTQAADLLEPTLAYCGDHARGMWGALHLHAAVSLARAGRDGLAWARWDRAELAVRRLPGGYWHPWTAFGRGNVDLHAISLSVDLWRSREALRRAERIDPDTVPSRERRGRLFVEMARGYHANGDRVAACRMLLRACDEGPDAVIWSPAARLIADDLKAHPPVGLREDVAALAARVTTV